MTRRISQDCRIIPQLVCTMLKDNKHISRPFYSFLFSQTWPLNGSEAAGDLVSDNDPIAFVVQIKLTSWHLNGKSGEVCTKARLYPALLAFTGQVTRHTTEKWLIENGKPTQRSVWQHFVRGYVSALG